MKKLLEYCDENDGYEDVKKILEKIPASSKVDDLPARDKTVSSDQHGYVYLIRSGNRYKIGESRSPLQRAANIATQTPDGAEPVHWFLTDDPKGIEKYWHTRFAAKRIVRENTPSGEWFALSAEDIRAFKRRKKFM